jgi:MFS family permease
MYLVYSLMAYPCGVLADHVPRRLQLAVGAAILIGADFVLASASSFWATALGAALWGLQLGITQGLLGATVADAASDRLRGTAFGIYDVAIGVTTFAASAGAGVLWTAAGSAAVFAVGACIAAIAGLLVLLRPLPARAPASTT